MADDRARLLVHAFLASLPHGARPFTASEYGLPVHAAYLGERDADLTALAAKIESGFGPDAKPILDPLLMCAEALESVQPDRERFFIPDSKLQEFVFMGSKWRAGWALVLGGGAEKLIEELQKREFMVFTDEPGLRDTWDIGPRDTSPLYFLQMMVRYGLIWGRIAPGDDHEMGHFLERDMPGVVVIRKDLPPLKYLVTLGLMKLGAPAVVPSSFPFPYGNRVVADSDEQILAHIGGFENLRTREYGEETISLPGYANIAWVNQEFSVAGRLGGTPLSFLCMRPTPDQRPTVVQGELPEEEGEDIGILIDVRDARFSLDISALVEQAAYRALNCVDGWRARKQGDGLSIEWSASSPFDAGQAVEVLRQGIRLQFPGLEDFDIRVIRSRRLLESLAPQIARFKEERSRFIHGMTEENTTLFAACTECRPFSLVHTCVITPDRTPMCASRSYFSVKASSLFGSDQRPYRRRAEMAIPLRTMFERGKILDLARGEYEGANEIYKTLTNGLLSRVRLHSLDEVPHTSCGCFQNLAFRIKDHGGIGIMKRGSAAVTPDGRTWEMLANYAGGKQSDGIMGVSLQYILSANFLRGDGGLRSVVWLDSDLHGKIRGHLPTGHRVATEKDVRTIEELAAFVLR